MGFQFRDEFTTTRAPHLTGSVTLANARLSLVNGTAFVDFSEANVLTDHVGMYLVLTDAAGKSAWGWIKAAGTGETLSETELISGWANHGSSFDTFTLSGTDIASGINNAGAAASIYAPQLTSPAGKLYKYSTALTINSGALTTVRISPTTDGGTPAVEFLASPTTGSRTGYGTGIATATYFRLVAADAVNFSATGNSLKQVLTPSATGVTITSTPGGTTYNWTSIDSGFDYNASAGYSWAIYADATQVVNGSAAEPGVGTRTVTDTENKLTIANGALTFAGGKGTPAYGDPGVWYPAITRAAGKMVIAEATASDVTDKGGPVIGFDSNTLAGITDGIYLSWSDNLLRSIGTDDVVVGAALSTGTSYAVAVALRASGSFRFLKIGGVWKLLYIHALPNTATLYPTISNRAATFTSSFLRLPSTLWLPSPLVSDGFSAWGVSDGKGHQEETGLGSGGAGKTWSGTTWSASGGKAINTPTLGEELATGTLTVGTWYSITATEENHFYTGCAVGHTFRAGATTALDANNKVKAITLSELISVVETSTRDVIATVAIAATPAGTQAGLAVGIDSATDPKYGIFAYHDGIKARLDKIVNGVWTSVISAAATWANNAEIRVIRDGTSFRLYYNNAQVGSTSTVADVGDGTLHGLFNTHTTPMDNFTVYARGTNNEYSQLDVLQSSGGGKQGIGFGFGWEF